MPQPGAGIQHAPALQGVEGDMRGRLAAICIVLTAPAYASDLSAVLDRIPQSSGAVVERTVPLSRIGYESGVTLNGFQGGVSVFLPMPARSVVREAEAIAVIDKAVFEGLRAAMSLGIGGQVRKAEGFTPGEGTLTYDLPLSPGDYPDGNVRLDLKFSAALTENRCFDDRFEGLFLTLRPESGLRVLVGLDDVTTPSAAWSILPNDVTILLPARTLSAGEFAAALHIGRALLEEGRTVAYRRILPDPAAAATPPVYDLALVGLFAGKLLDDSPAARAEAERAAAAGDPNALAGAYLGAGPNTTGDIVIGDDTLAALHAAHANVLNALAARSPEDAARLRALAASDAAAAPTPSTSGETPAEAAPPPSAPAISDVRLERFSNRPVIVVRGAGTQVYALGALAAGEGRGEGWLAAGNDNSARRVGLYQISSGDLGVKDVANLAEWSLPFSARDLPPGTEADRIELALSIGADIGEAAATAHVFLNDRLIRSQRLDSSGGMARLSADVPSSAVHLDNVIRVVVRRALVGSECLVPPQPVPIEISRESALVLTGAPETPRGFYQLASAFNSGAHLVLGPEALADAPDFLGFLASMSRSFLPAPQKIALQIGGDASAVAAKGPFVVVGAMPPAGAETPLDPARGALSIEDRRGRTLVNPQDLTAMNMAEIVSLKGVPGLYIQRNTPFNLKPRTSVVLDRGNVAFLDRDGVALWLDTNESRGLTVTNASGGAFAGLFERYRVWVIVIGWVVLTVAFVFSVTRMRR